MRDTITIAKSEFDRLQAIESAAKRLDKAGASVNQMNEEQWAAYTQLKGLFHGGVLESGTISPLMSNVESATIERVMQHLENALAPHVRFSEDVEQMRQEAERCRIHEIEAAMRILYNNVAGLTYRPRLNDAEEIYA